MIDHINGLVNDNRKINLRLSNASLNQANKRKAKNKSTEFKGVVARPHGYEVSEHLMVISNDFSGNLRLTRQ